MNDMHTSNQSTITIIANGQPHSLKNGSSIADLLRTLDISPSRIVAQMNGEIVYREAFANTVLHEGDRLDLVTLVGGG